MSKVQNNHPEITKDEVQSATKTLHARKYYNSASLKNEVLKSCSDSFLNSMIKMLKERKTTTRTMGRSKYSNSVQG